MPLGKSYRKKTMYAHPRLWKMRVLRCWPFAVWLLAAALAVRLYMGSQQFGGMTGFVETIVEPIAPLETARLISVDVTVGQEVCAGDILARMDTSMLEAQLAISEAQMLEAEGSIAGFQQNMLQMVRQFDSAVKDAKTSLEVLQGEFQSNQAELTELRKEHKRLTDLLQQRLIGENELGIIRPQLAALEQSVGAYPGMVETAKERLQQATAKRAYLDVLLQVEKDEGIMEAIARKTEARTRIMDSGRQKRALQKDSYILRATRDGIVSRVFYNPGDVVPAGQVIMRVVSEDAEYVWGFLPEAHIATLRTGQEALVFRQQGDSQGIKAVVASITPEIQALPGRVSPIRAQPLRGLRVRLKLTEPHTMIPGETVKILPPYRWFARRAGATDDAPPADSQDTQ